MIRSVALILCLAVSAFGQLQTGGNGTVVARTPYVFATFETVKGLDRLVKKTDYDTAVADDRFVMEDLKYLSDGLTVEAYLYRPRDIRGKKLPLVIFNRGNYLVGDIGAESVPMFRRLALEGFVVLAPLLRGSHGAPGKDEVGGADLDDIMNTLPLVRSFDFVDQANLFMYGHSRGGMMTFQAVRDGYPLRAAATVGGFTDFAGLVRPIRSSMTH
jgi:dipeptidyl aminopeptidase/acylaminoacyl peptidase